MTRKSKKKIMTVLTAITVAGTLSMAGQAFAGDSAYITGSDPTDLIVSFYNSTDSSFNSASGITQLQQNNGAGNALQQGVSVLDSGIFSSSLSSGSSKFADLDNVSSTDLGVIIPASTVTYYSLNSSTDDGTDGSEGPFYDSDDLTPVTFVTSYQIIYSTSTNQLTNSFDSVSGISNVQQNNGNNNAMQQDVAVAAGTGSGTIDGSASARGSVWGGFNWNSIVSFYNNMYNSFNGANGISNVQQNNGSNNAMQQDVSVASVSDATAPDPGGYDYDENIYATNQTESHASVGNSFDWNVANFYTNELNASFNGASGISQAAQNNGSNNVMQQSVSELSFTNAGEPGPGYDGDAGLYVSNTNDLTGKVKWNADVQIDTPEYNNINDAFVGASGVNDVQQNNGSNNVMQQAVAITASTGTHTGQIVSVSAVSSNDLDATVTGNCSLVMNSSNTNTISGSAFNSASGITNVSQNNGSNNVIQQAVSVAYVH